MKNSHTKQIATHISNDCVAFGLPQSKIDKTTIRHIPRLQLLTADGCDEGAYFPAQSINIYGKEAIAQLRDFCNEILEPK